MPHGHPQGWAPVEIGLFVDQHLHGGKPLARVESVKRDGSRVEVKFRSEVPVTSAALHFTTDTGPWQKRKWQSRRCRRQGQARRAARGAAAGLLRDADRRPQGDRQHGHVQLDK